MKNGKKVHHQKAERRTCSEEQGSREPAAGGIPLHGNASLLQPKERMGEKNRFMSSQLPRAVNTSRAAASLLVSGSGTKSSDTIKKIEHTDGVGG